MKKNTKKIRKCITKQERNNKNKKTAWKNREEKSFEENEYTKRRI